MGEQSYLSPDVGPETVASFFRAAARLFRAKPWEIGPNAQTPFSVTIKQLGVRDVAALVIGQMGQSLGLVLFSSLDDLNAYVLNITDERCHHEIYLSDARKVAPERLRTFVRHPIRTV